MPLNKETQKSLFHKRPPGTHARELFAYYVTLALGGHSTPSLCVLDVS